jgi:hypothetical protein
MIQTVACSFLYALLVSDDGSGPIWRITDVDL